MKIPYGDLIKQAREDAGLTVAQLADKCYIQEWQLELAEEGEIELSDEEFVLITNALSMSSKEMKKGKLRKNKDMPDLDELLKRAEQKAAELQETILEMKAAAAAITGRSLEPELTAEKKKENAVEKSVEANTTSAAPEQKEEIQAPRL